ncbi:MAG: hypothetical protein HQM10_07260 [Candidatus Riflebacteria bacterium]|nr:hypothetical protein [Candidatus Riflebacteria bacterium]
MEQVFTDKMQRTGFLNLPSWHKQLKSLLSEYEKGDLLFAPVLNAEDSDQCWRSLESDDFFASVDTGIAFHSVSGRLPTNVVTSDSEFAVKLISEKLADRVGYRAALGAIQPALDLKYSFPGNFIPGKILALCDGQANALLLEMEKRFCTLDEALSEIQWKGLANQTPLKSVHGILLKERILLLAWHFYRYFPESKNLQTSGLKAIQPEDMKFVRELGACIRLAGRLEFRNNVLKVRISPVLLHDSHPLAKTTRNAEGILLADEKNEHICIGQIEENVSRMNGIIKDLTEIRKGETRKNEAGTDEEISFSDENFESKYYLRFSLENFSSTLSQIASAFSHFEIQLERVIQPRLLPELPEQLIFVTAKTEESLLKKALREIDTNVRLAALRSCHEIEGSLDQN